MNAFLIFFNIIEQKSFQLKLITSLRTLHLRGKQHQCMANHEKWASYIAYQFVREKKYWLGYTLNGVCMLLVHSTTLMQNNQLKVDTIKKT